MLRRRPTLWSCWRHSRPTHGQRWAVRFALCIRKYGFLLFSTSLLHTERPEHSPAYSEREFSSSSSDHAPPPPWNGASCASPQLAGLPEARFQGARARGSALSQGSASVMQGTRRPVSGACMSMPISSGFTLCQTLSCRCGRRAWSI
jgi:hypothetical protein